MEKPVGLGTCKIEHLGRDGRPPALVVLREILPLGAHHHVVALPQHEAPYEMGLAEGEDAIVEDHIHAAGEVFAAKGRVAIQLVHLMTWRTGDEAHTDGVGGRLGPQHEGANGPYY